MVDDGVLDTLLSLSNQAMSVQDRDTLLGIEGIAAKINFDNLPRLLNDSGMEFNGRSRRPPRDPVNAMLSYAYSLLAKDFVNAIIAVGLEPSVGYYHAFEKWRPALALDLMESYRPLIADSSVIRDINTKMLKIEDFEVTMAGISMKAKAKKQFMMAYEQRMNTMVMHPMFEYQMSYRRILEVEVRLLSRYLEGELKN